MSFAALVSLGGGRSLSLEAFVHHKLCVEHYLRSMENMCQQLRGGGGVGAGGWGGVWGGVQERMSE